MRIYSNYSSEEFACVKKFAESHGFSSLSSFQHYAVMLHVGGVHGTADFEALKREMLDNMRRVKEGKPFIVSSLLAEVWPSLDRSAKITLAKHLASEVNHNPAFSTYKKVRGKTTYYVKKPQSGKGGE